MKDVSHHLRFIQKKVIQHARKEVNQPQNKPYPNGVPWNNLEPKNKNR